MVYALTEAQLKQFHAQGHDPKIVARAEAAMIRILSNLEESDFKAEIGSYCFTMFREYFPDMVLDIVNVFSDKEVTK